jgi:hypothetical protein
MGHEIAGGVHEVASPDDLAPPVRIEPCATFRADHAAAWTVCDTCGWLEDDHAVEYSGAVVTALPRRGVRLPERKAS